MEQQEKASVSNRLRIVIIVLTALLLLSAGGLAARYIYLQFFAPTQTTVAVPDNLIGENHPAEESGVPAGSAPPQMSGPGTERAAGNEIGGTSGSSRRAERDKPAAVRLELYGSKPGDNQKFEVRNMLPGDTEIGYFCVKAHHDKDIELFFKVGITEQTKALGEVLHIKVSHLETGKVLCDAPFNEIDGKGFSELLKANGEKATTAYYEIEASLDTSVGNEYQAALLKADFNWYVEDEGGLLPPPTGDSFNLVLWITLAASSLLLLLLLAFRRRKEGGQNG